jgi:tRNA(Ile2) C34 agmatinyltransferase TiaS
MNEQQPLCDSCGNRLTLKRTCTSVTFLCPQCRAEYPLARFIHLMDETMEQQLGGLRCDRV